MILSEKFKSSKGASLSETLVTVLIMSLVTLAIAAGITAGMRVYRKITVRAEEQTLLSTSVAAVSDYFEKSVGTIVPTADGGADIAYTESAQTRVQIKNGTENNRGLRIGYFDQNGNPIKLETTDSNNKDMDDQPLISEKSNTSDLYAVISGINKAETNTKAVSFTITIYDQDGPTNQSEDVTVRRIVQNPDIAATLNTESGK